MMRSIPASKVDPPAEEEVQSFLTRAHGNAEIHIYTQAQHTCTSCLHTSYHILVHHICTRASYTQTSYACIDTPYARVCITYIFTYTIHTRHIHIHHTIYSSFVYMCCTHKHAYIEMPYAYMYTSHIYHIHTSHTYIHQLRGGNTGRTVENQ